MEPRMRNDCFAKPKWIRGRVECDAIHTSLSRKALECESCGFYRSEEDNKAELMRCNGTDDVDVAVAMYCLNHTNEPKKLKLARKIVRTAAAKYPAVNKFWAEQELRSRLK